MRTDQLKRIEPTHQPSSLISLSGQVARTIPLSPFVVLGRDPDCHIHLQDSFVSLRHARIVQRDGRYLLIDLKSRNGTFVNDQRVGEIYLNDQDRIQVGKTNFIFSVEETFLIPEAPRLTSRNSEFQKTLTHLPIYARTGLHVMIIGPSGAGKELIAKAIHDLSPRKSGPFVTINCSALTESLFESELFGHRRGSFTGAIEDRKGAFAMADGGTLFLDEIGDLPLSQQPKLLRAIENKEIRPVGSENLQKVDVRVVCATHKSLIRLIQEGLFRADLYYRLNAIDVSVPSLRNRPEDLEFLIYQFAREFRACFSLPAIEKLKEHPWPGNIRELRNTMAKAAALHRNQRISENDIENILIPPTGYAAPLSLHPTKEGPQKMKDIERSMIERQLMLNRGNQRRTADDLGIPKSTLHDKIKLYHIDLQGMKKADLRAW
jgi:DNA-binding NtrC family response regulator